MIKNINKPQNKIPKLLITSILGLVLIVILFSINIALGSVNIPFNKIINSLQEVNADNIVWKNIILHTRLPQAIVALAAGSALGVSGLLMQTLFKNPLAGPSVLGISSGAGLGVAFVIMVAGQIFNISFTALGNYGNIIILLAALIGSLGILMIILFVSHKVGGSLAVLIMGVMIGYMSNSLVSIMKFYSLEEDVHTYVIWGLGSFSRLSLEQAKIFLLIAIIPTLLTILLAKPLNLLSLGDNYARNLGLKIQRARFIVILVAGILTAIVTAFAGPIIFIGMAVPHMAKIVSRTSNHFHLIINSAILGAATALFCNLIARMPGIDSSLPINSVTAFVGAPVVISVIWKRRKDQLMQ